VRLLGIVAAAGSGQTAVVALPHDCTVTQVEVLPGPRDQAGLVAALAPSLEACDRALIAITGADADDLVAALQRAHPGKVTPVRIASGATSRRRGQYPHLPGPLLTATLQQACAQGMVRIAAQGPGRALLERDMADIAAALAPPSDAVKFEARAGRSGAAATALALVVLARLMPEFVP